MAKKLEYNTDYLFNYDVKESVNSVIDEVDGLTGDVDALINANGGKNVSFVAGVIRNDGSGWKLIDDAYHTGLQIDSVSNDTSKITIDYSSLGAKKTLGFVITNDETYARLGYSIGNSILLTQAHIYIHKTAGNRSAALFQYNTATGVTIPFGQAVGISSVSWDATNKLVVVNHNDFGPNHLSVVPNVSPRRTCPSSWKIDSITTTQTAFWFEDLTGAKITPPDGTQFFFNRGDGYVQENINPNLVSNPIGNFWFIGAFEM